MKKLDFLIFSVIILFISILYIIFNYKTNNINITNNIQIIINNEIIDNVTLNDNNKYLILSDNTYIYIYKNNSLFKTITNKYKKNIYNVITIQNNTVKMEISNCIGLNCTHMEINVNKNLPIICTNGIVIKKNINNDNDIIV